MSYLDGDKFRVDLLVNNDELRDALQDVVNVFTDEEIAESIGPRLTCTEAGMIADLIGLIAGSEAANVWLTGHGTGDAEPTDVHHDYYLMSEASIPDAE